MKKNEKWPFECLSALFVLLILIVSICGCSNRSADSETKISYGTFKKTGQMVIPRFIPTAILLKTGKVLVFGGQIDSNSADFKLGEARPKQAELYDPVTEKFELTGNINIVRVNYTTTLLQDGRVLITGGDMGLLTKDEIEIFDPKSGQFSIVGKLKEARENHQATLLKNGEVLITGGEETNPDKYRPLGMDQYQIHDTAEIFNPKTNQTRLLKNKMHYPRVHHSATLLPDGQVLIVAGVRHHDAAEPGDEVETYNPRTEAFTNRSPMLIPSLTSPSALLLQSGNVLLAGGGKGRSGIEVGHPHLSTAQIYDSSTGQFHQIGSMNFERAHPQLVQLGNGKVLVIGGILQDPFHPIDPIELFDPKSNSFQYIGKTLLPSTAVALPERRVLFVGSNSTKQDAISAEIYSY